MLAQIYQRSIKVTTSLFLSSGKFFQIDPNDISINNPITDQKHDKLDQLVYSFAESNPMSGNVCNNALAIFPP